jgi:hypothetical protein
MKPGRVLSVRAWPIADLVITVALLILFAWALSSASEWSVKAALFPRLVTTFGLALAVLHLVLLLVRRRSADDSAEAQSVMGISEPDDDPLAYAFSTAGRLAWMVALAWVAGFFVSLYVLGVYVTAPLFTVLYLRLSAHASWRLSVIYSVVVGAVLYGVFETLLGLPTPEGVLF